MAICASQIACAAVLLLCCSTAFSVLRYPLVEGKRITVVELSIIILALFADHLRTKDVSDDRLDVRSLSFVCRRALEQTACVGVAFFAYAFLAKDASISRAFLSCYLATLCGALMVSGWVLPRLLGRIFFRGHHQTRTLLLGTIDSIERYSGWIRAKQHLGIQIIGVVAPPHDSVPGCVSPFPILGTADRLSSILAEHQPDAVVHLDIPPDQGSLDDYRTLCDRFGARFLALCDFARTLSRSVSFFFDGGVHVMAINREPLQSPVNRTVKRCFDVCVSLPVACLVLPLLAVMVWVIHRLQSPGPLLYRQVRAGQNGTPFVVWKFRTMHANNPDETLQAFSGDTRIFPMGRWLRKLSLDEFPQFLNVLLGNMSIVGPRPHLPAHDEVFADVVQRYRVRNFVKPGITGLAQIKGFRGETRTDRHIIERVESDVFYLENWSILLDFHIVLKTIPQMIFPPTSAC